MQARLRLSYWSPQKLLIWTTWPVRRVGARRPDLRQVPRPVRRQANRFKLALHTPIYHYFV